jgi:enamine deaminase RidA (YjgF/YER057c/UK114 family)
MKIVRYEPGTVLSGAVRAGHYVFVSGTVPDDLGLDVAGQTKQVLDKIDALLKQAGSHKAHIVSASIWLTDIRNREAMNKVWLTWMDPKNPPARATVEAKLADARMLVEIACIAVISAEVDQKPAKVAKSAKATKPLKPAKPTRSRKP